MSREADHFRQVSSDAGERTFYTKYNEVVVGLITLGRLVGYALLDIAAALRERQS